MNPKIMAVGIVKNEADLIEAFIRYHCLFLDRMILLDNRSTDETLPIMRKLEQEGLPVIVLEDRDPGYFQIAKTSRLIQLAIDEYQADFVLPLDADEFLTSVGGAASPRSLLERLQPDLLHYVQWRTYLPHATDDVDEPCVIWRMQHARPVSAGDLCKVIVPAQLWQEHGLQVIAGNHDVISLIDPVQALPRLVSRDLCLAHFPVRSLEQIKTKAFIGQINRLAQFNRFTGDAPQMQRLFTDLKLNRVQEETFAGYAKDYLGSFQRREELRPIGWPGAERLAMRYSVGKACSWLSKGMENMEMLAIESQQFAQEGPSWHLTQLEPESVRRKIGERQQLLQELQRSFSWRLTAPLRFFARLARALRQRI
jgi:hypothetical protein